RFPGAHLPVSDDGRAPGRGAHLEMVRLLVQSQRGLRSVRAPAPAAPGLRAREALSVHRPGCGPLPPAEDAPMTLRPLAIPMAILSCILMQAFAEPPAQDPIDAFRERLANPALYPLRKGKSIDMVALQEILKGFTAANTELLRQRFKTSLDALPEGSAP